MTAILPKPDLSVAIPETQVAQPRLRVLLIASYEMGRQPFGVASATAWLTAAGHDVECQDLAIERIDAQKVAAADIVAFYVPMHTATRMAAKATARVKGLNPDAHLVFFGLYASVNQELCQELGIDTVLGGEFETGLVSLADRIANGREELCDSQAEPIISLDRQRFLTPDRSKLPSLEKYAFLTMPDGTKRQTGYTEATRGCKHLCRHCPIVPVYGGRFRVVDREVVIADIGQQVEAGAQHITFGDPDFFNGPAHALKIVRELHRLWPELTYDVTIKAEHLLHHPDKLSVLAETGCVMLTCAFESIDDHILEIFDKRHTREEMEQAVTLLRGAGIALNPTFVAFSPWISLGGYQELLRWIAEQDLIENVTPIQYAIRLLIPAGSRLLELPQTWEVIGDFDPGSLAYPWVHPDPAVDRMQERVMELVQEGLAEKLTRPELFARIWKATTEALGSAELVPTPVDVRRAPVPYLSEPWYC